MGELTNSCYLESPAPQSPAPSLTPVSLTPVLSTNSNTFPLQIPPPSVGAYPYFMSQCSPYKYAMPPVPQHTVSYMSQMPTYSMPQMPTYSMPQMPTYSTPQMPTYSTPQMPTYSTPQIPTYSTPQMPTYSTPPRAKRAVPQQLMPPPKSSPRRPISDILGRYNKEKDAGRVAVHLAQFYYLGETATSRTTAAHLDSSKMEEIKELILSKFASRRSLADREELWRKCRVAIGQKCKQLRGQKKP